MDDQLDSIDFAVAVYRRGEDWFVHELVPERVGELDPLIAALRRFVGLAGGESVLGLVAIDEDFFIVVLVDSSSVRLLLSDVTAAQEWSLADEVLERLGFIAGDDDEPSPGGDLGVFGDLGMSAVDLAMLLDDEELFPDEALSQIAVHLGFGAQFDDAVGLTSA